MDEEDTETLHMQLKFARGAKALVEELLDPSELPSAQPNVAKDVVAREVAELRQELERQEMLEKFDEMRASERSGRVTVCKAEEADRAEVSRLHASVFTGHFGLQEKERTGRAGAALVGGVVAP